MIATGQDMTPGRVRVAADVLREHLRTHVSFQFIGSVNATSGCVWFAVDNGTRERVLRHWLAMRGLEAPAANRRLDLSLRAIETKHKVEIVPMRAGSSGLMVFPKGRVYEAVVDDILEEVWFRFGGWQP